MIASFSKLHPMKTVYPISLFAIFLFSSTLLHSQKSVYTFPFENEYRLPPMTTQINLKEISSTYQTYGNIYTTEIIGFAKDTMEQTSYSFISDTKVLDAVRFLEFYMEEQLLYTGEEKTGSVEMSIIYFEERSRFNAGSVFAILTIGISVLCGAPIATNVTDLEVEASFYNKGNQSIAVHRGVGRGKKTVSIYSISTRKAHQEALRNALENLNNEVMSDLRLRPDLAISVN
jgi:hypothetical protein